MWPLLAALIVAAEPPGPALVTHAREVLGTPYEFGGRLRGKTPGIDCQGVLFYALERAFPRCGWKSYSVMPTVSIPTAELGPAVSGMNPVSSAAVDLGKLEPGDFLWFVGPAENPAEPAIAKLGGADVWVWHTGLYAGDGKFIVGDHYAGEAVETPLLPYLREHADTYSGLIVTRIEKRPKPARCRRHRPMQRPRRSTDGQR
jgi:cell wall-associated NlpC family hydrolase